MDAGVLHGVDVVARELMLFAGAGLLVGGIDDLLVDLVFLGLRARRLARRRPHAPSPPAASDGTRIAVLVAAWREGGVIGAMLVHALRQWQGDGFRLFVACYPNDPGTVEAVAAVAERDPRVCLVLNPRPGPTTKADNLNAAFAAAEREGGYAAMLLHDAEDVVHRSELDLVREGLADGLDMVQLPVVPLVHPRSRLIGGHYADEFAEAA